MQLKPGDIIGFSGSRWWNHAINLATFGLPLRGLSHVAIMSTSADEPLLFESTAHCDLPCYFSEERVSGFQAHLPFDRIQNATGAVWHYPLKHKLRPLERARLFSFLMKQLGKDYDYSGASKTGGILSSLVMSLFNQECLESLFCSELCAAAHAHIGRLKTENASRWSPNHLVRVERLMGILDKPVRLQ